MTGEFLTGQAYARQTWAKGLDAKGRPIVIADTDPSDKGTFIWPNANGATIWFSPSFDPARRWIFVPVRTRGATYFKRAMEYRPGRYYPGGGETEMQNIDVSGEIRAMDALTGDMKWTFPLLSPASSGVLSTAGGLVFTGTDEGDFLALDSASGRPLWHVGTGSRIQTNPMSYGLDGQQVRRRRCGPSAVRVRIEVSGEVSMKSRALGNTGIEIAPLVLGGNVFGWTVDEARALGRALDRAADAGLDTIDTADSYSAWAPGNSKAAIEHHRQMARALRPRNTTVIITKVSSAVGPYAQDMTASISWRRPRIHCAVCARTASTCT